MQMNEINGRTINSIQWVHWLSTLVSEKSAHDQVICKLEKNSNFLWVEKSTEFYHTIQEVSDTDKIVGADIPIFIYSQTVTSIGSGAHFFNYLDLSESYLYTISTLP